MINSTIHTPAITSLIVGYQQFKTKFFKKSCRYTQLVTQGQQPKVLMIACCDSRVDPAILTNSGPGDLFVVRNIANLVPHYNDDADHLSISSALEYGVLTLNVTDIIVLGHSHCGGIRALMQTKGNCGASSFIQSWLDSVKSTKDAVLKKYSACSINEQTHHLEKESLLASMNNLNTFPFINQRVVENKLALHAWYFNLKTGDLQSYHASTNRFIPLA